MRAALFGLLGGRERRSRSGMPGLGAVARRFQQGGLRLMPERATPDRDPPIGVREQTGGWISKKTLSRTHGRAAGGTCDIFLLASPFSERLSLTYLAEGSPEIGASVGKSYLPE